jgi:CheY-like chemotaxis protein
MSFSEFTSERIAAEILQQMEGVLALTDRLSRERLGPEAEQCVDGVTEAAASVRRILTDSIELKAAADGGLSFAPQAHRLQDVMDEIQTRWERRTANSGATLLVSYDGDPDACAMVDAPRLGRVFDGFIAQAVASARRGAVEASLKALSTPDGMRLEGRVRGAGDPLLGADGVDIQQIEARFGLETALGVAIGKQIIGDLRGDLRSEANAGAGQTVVFEVLVPAVAEEIEAQPHAAAERTAHVLVVDDNATNRMVAETLCEMFDCTAESATDGVEAVEAARTGRFDLILMDIKMPRMDGVAATKAIRALPGAPGRVPIIALTANADPEDAQGYLSAGMNGVVEKPMKPENLLNALQQALAGSDAAAAA